MSSIRNLSSVNEIFQASQVTAAVHQKNSIILKNLYDNSSHDEFFIHLKDCLNAMLAVDFKKKNIYVDKIVDFFAKFCSLLKPTVNDEEIHDHPLLTNIIVYLLEASELASDIVRYRSCQILNRILNNLIGIQVSEDLFEKIQEILLPRLQDPKYVIKMQVILCLFHLQDPTNPEDDIISSFLSIINSDPFAKVRQLCVEKIAIREDTIPCVLRKIRDVDANVRLAAFKRLSKLARFLKIIDKRLILKCGLLDDSRKIREYMSTDFINVWLETYNDDPLELMRAIRLDASEKDISETVTHYEFILDVIFKQKNLKELSGFLKTDENKLYPFGDLNWEVASYWRLYMQFLNERIEFEDELDKVQPDFNSFCQYIKSYCTDTPVDSSIEEFMEYQFIIKQLIHMVRTYSFDDPSRCQILNSLVCDILQKSELLSDVTEVILGTLECSIPNIDSRCRYVSELISEIMYPIISEEEEDNEREKDFQISKLKVQLDVLVEDQSLAIKNEQYLEADRLKNEITNVKSMLNTLMTSTIEEDQVQKRTDIPTIIKYLDIAHGLLLSPEIVHLNDTLKALKNNVIQELLMHDNDLVKSKAFQCYCLCCILDKSDARSGIHIFSAPILAYKAGEECDSQILLVCIAAVVDLLRLYGSNLISEPDEDLSDSVNEEEQKIFVGGTSLTDLVQGLVDLLNDEQLEIQEAAGIGLCKLLLSERLMSASLLSRLILKWCNPASDESNSDLLKQIIGHTLRQAPLLPNGTEQLEGSVLLTIKTLVYAPLNSPLADIDVDNIAKFIMTLCRISPEGIQIHSNILFKICSEIKSKPKRKINITYSKMLAMADLPEDKTVIRDLVVIAEEARDNTHDKVVLRNLVKFIAKLTEQMGGNLSFIADDDCKTEQIMTETVVNESSYVDSESNAFGANYNHTEIDETAVNDSLDQ